MIFFFYFLSFCCSKKVKKAKLKLNFIISRARLQGLITKQTHKKKGSNKAFIHLIAKITMNRTKKVKAKDSGDDTIPGHLPQAWRKPRGVPYPILSFLLVVMRKMVVMK